MTSKNFKILNIVIFSLLGIGMIVSTFLDYQIMVWLDQQNNLGNIFNDYAELPAILLPAAFFTFLVVHFFKKKKSIYKLASLILMIMVLLIVVFGINKFFEDYGIIEISITLFYILSIVIIFFKLPEDISKKIFNFLLLSTLLILASNLSCQIVKIFWGRIRFRDLNNSYEFSLWFIPQGINGNKSFFSGHTVAAANTLIILFIPDVFKNVKTIPYRLTIIFLALFIAATAYSRIVVGAHYPSDVIFSVIVVYALILIIKKYFLVKILNRFSLN